MAATKNRTIKDDFVDTLDNLGPLYMTILFISGAIWAFIAINNVLDQGVFKQAMIYSILLIFGFIAVSYDRRAQKLGLDSRIWESKNIRLKLIIGLVVLAGWYLLFIDSGFSVATASVGTNFSVNPTLNYFLISVLGPLAENIFFFGVLNITLVTLLRRFSQDKVQGTTVAVLIYLSSYLFANVPNITLYCGLSAISMLIATWGNSKTIRKYATIFASAFFIGGAIFPAFHGYAYQLNEKNYIAASYFGILMCIIASYIGIIPVDIVHIGNNAIVAASG